MATGSYLTPNHSRSQSEIQGDLHKFMRARNYYAHPNMRDHWALRCMNRCPDLVVCLKRDLQCLRPQASLVLTYRPNTAGMKGRVDLAQSSPLIGPRPVAWNHDTLLPLGPIR
ncbi:hypothetical protein TNCV_346781 [Trichonephila clavipes]|nr:hypothetical protein TNCV_346781 [Trichonephila clavipes]